MYDFSALDIQLAGMQVLESTYLIATSKNIDTIISRYSFLIQRIETLKGGQSNPQYSSCIQFSKEKYKTVYYNRELQDYQLSILLNPSRFDLDDFYCNSLVNAINRYCQEQKIGINGMKSESAKVKRVAKDLAKIKLVKDELQRRCINASSYSKKLVEIENLEKSNSISS